MVHNIFVLMKSLTSPRKLLAKSKDDVTTLHHRSEPVPGIYTHNVDGHYLVGLKPKHGRSHDSMLFVSRIGFNKSEIQTDLSAEIPPTPMRRDSGLFLQRATSSLSSFDKPAKGTISATDLGGYRYV